MQLSNRSKSVESIAVTTADRRNMFFAKPFQSYPERVVVQFNRHGRGYQRQTDFEVDITFEDVLAIIDEFAQNGHAEARLLKDGARAIAALNRIEGEIAALKGGSEAVAHGKSEL